MLEERKKSGLGEKHGEISRAVLRTDDAIDGVTMS